MKPFPMSFKLQHGFQEPQTIIISYGPGHAEVEFLNDFLSCLDGISAEQHVNGELFPGCVFLLKAPGDMEPIRFSMRVERAKDEDIIQLYDMDGKELFHFHHNR